MSLLEGFDTMRLVKAGLSLRQRIERCIAARHHKAVIARLQRLRRQLEEDMRPELWTMVEGPMSLLLADVCEALGLSGGEQASVMGAEGVLAVAEILEARPVPRPYALLNQRQAQALAYVREHSRITNREFRDLCPDVSAETARLDLGDLVARGLLVRNGRGKGTSYTPAT